MVVLWFASQIEYERNGSPNSTNGRGVGFQFIYFRNDSQMGLFIIKILKSYEIDGCKIVK